MSEVKTGTVVPAGGALARQEAGTIARTEFSGDQMSRSGETAGTALAAQARAIVEARFLVAMKRPRDLDDVRVKLLRACERPGFAKGPLDERGKEVTTGVAFFHKPVGDGIEGFSIRFVEEALRGYGNCDHQQVTVYDDPSRRLVCVTLTDLESNISYSQTVTIEKSVERSNDKGREVLGQRLNSWGKTVYSVVATDDELLGKEGSLCSKALRNLGLKLIPGDIQAECRKRILEIRHGDAAKDPDGFRKKVLDGFAKLNVQPSDLKQFLGHDVGTATPAELTDLQDLWKAIQAGETTWHQVMGREDETPPTNGVAGLKAKIGGEPTPPPTPPAATPPTPAPAKEEPPAAPPAAPAPEKSPEKADDRMSTKPGPKAADDRASRSAAMRRLQHDDDMSPAEAAALKKKLDEQAAKEGGGGR